MATLEDLNLHSSANFESDEACMFLARLVDTANALRDLDIRWQSGERKVKVCVRYAVDADLADVKVIPKPGCIKIVYEYLQSLVICERATRRTKANKIKIKHNE